MRLPPAAAPGSAAGRRRRDMPLRWYPSRSRGPSRPAPPFRAGTAAVLRAAAPDPAADARRETGPAGRPAQGHPAPERPAPFTGRPPAVRLALLSPSFWLFLRACPFYLGADAWFGYSRSPQRFVIHMAGRAAVPLDGPTQTKRAAKNWRLFSLFSARLRLRRQASTFFKKYEQSLYGNLIFPYFSTILKSIVSSLFASFT